MHTTRNPLLASARCASASACHDRPNFSGDTARILEGSHPPSCGRAAHFRAVADRGATPARISGESRHAVSAARPNGEPGLDPLDATGGEDLTEGAPGIRAHAEGLESVVAATPPRRRAAP